MASTAMVEGLEKKRKIEEEWRSIYATKQSLTRADFPPDFSFGVATAAFQNSWKRSSLLTLLSWLTALHGLYKGFDVVEGACDEDGRGPSIWDAFSRAPGNFCDGSNAHVAGTSIIGTRSGNPDSEEDIELIAKLGFGAYRFSISWSRIFPDIQPYVTSLRESMGGWVNEDIVVKNWITINEPLQTAVNGYYTGVYAPGRREHSSNEPYLVAHHQLLAHAEADKQGGQIGLVVDCEWSEALSDRVEDRNATTRRLDFQLGWFLDPICFGDYPETMREKLGDRLPKFSERHKELLKNSVDFIGLNHYTTRFVCHATDNREDNDFYRIQELNGKVERQLVRRWDHFLRSITLALYGSLGHMESSRLHFYEIQQSPVYITENGMDDEEDGTSPFNHMLDDKLRVSYYKGYLAAIHQAIKDGANVRGYFAWSLLDNFEWHLGYTKRFGLIYVDYKNGLTRHLKSSAYWFSQFLKAEGGA
ncbi:UNVERIFIED_CONTAM: Beta-glucosidase 42 [Sesamum calycinum]|uniref:Beta-glucosidase 42 n=1 Tax=Sesamum calycinum TaxID=2727403 RepID=A0AAW2LVE2_9LAMI